MDKFIKDKHLSHCQIFKTDYLEFKPLKKEYYDALFSLGTLEHLPNIDWFGSKDRSTRRMLEEILQDAEKYADDISNILNQVFWK